MTAILNTGLDDNIKNLVSADTVDEKSVQLHSGQIYQGFGKDKAQYWSSYLPQSASVGPIENSIFDILIPPGSGNGGINVVDDLYLQMTITPNSSTITTEVTYKPVSQWLNRVEISCDGSSVLQTIYFDQQFAYLVTNSFVTNLDDMKEQINLDPRNYLPWYDSVAQGADVTIDATGLITATTGNVGRSAYLSQPYFRSYGTIGDPIGAGQLMNYLPNTKGGPLTADGRSYDFYLPIFGTILQQAQILLNQLTTNIRFRFYCSNEVKLFDQGSGASLTGTSLRNVILWASGSRLSTPYLEILNQKYQEPVVSSFNYYLEYTQEFSNGSPNLQLESVLSPITGLAQSLLIWLEDTRPDIAYPQPIGGGPGGFKYIQNNMMTLPLGDVVFVRDDGLEIY